MYLKGLEIQGFKSLADKIELQFNPGITAVVGPNGSGKSNIADAVRWVLGEQSIRSLRGTKLEDVIFSGSDRRKPVGMAEVSLNLDNSASIFPLAYSEVTVTRRVYRSGESEFLINKSPCRLKDIQELFVDTGIGREGYSIIGQGKIDEILSTRSEDRRVIIEEAAGIVKYKNRKQLAVKKLGDTAQNLVRLNDIINELAAQVGPLRAQAEEARDFLRLRDEAADLEVNLLVNQIADQEQKLAQINLKDEGWQQELMTTETLFRDLEAGIEGRRLLISKLDEEIAGKERELYDLGSGIERKEAQSMLAQERLKDLAAQQESRQQEILALRNKKDLVKAQLVEEERVLAGIRTKIKSGQKRLTEAEVQLSEVETGLQENQKELEARKADLIDLLNETAGVKNSINTGELGKQNLLRQLRQLDEQNRSLAREELAGRKKRKDLETGVSEVTKALETLTISENRLTGKRDRLNIHLNTMLGELAQIQASLQSKSFRLQALQDLQRDYQGYSQGVQEFFKEGRKGARCPGICGVIAEVIKVPPEYETAIEAALNSGLQFVITENENTARSALTMLKQNKSGRATFLPLNTVQPEAGQQDLSKFHDQPGCYGRASDLIKCEDKYYPLIKYLLGRVLVVDNLDRAWQIAQTAGYNLKVATLDGDVVNPGGSITGGTGKKGQAGLLARLRESGEIAAEVKKLARVEKALQTKISRTQFEYEQTVAQTGEIKARLQELVTERNSLRKDLDLVRLEQEKTGSTKQLVAAEIQNLQAETENTDSVLHSQGMRFQQLQLEDQEIRQSITGLQELLPGLETARVRLANLVTQGKVELAGLTQEETNRLQILTKAGQTIEEVQAQIRTKEEQAKKGLTQQESWQAEINLHRQEIHELNQQKGLTEDRLNQLRRDRQALVAAATEEEGQLKNLAQEIARLREQLHVSDLKRTRCEFEAENSLHKLTEEFQISYPEALLKKTEIENKKEAVLRLKELKEAIAALGSVNLGAIAEFARVQERYEFLQKQECDLQQAEASLYKVIAEIDQLMTRKFGEVFTAVNRNFTEVFARLFNGGKAELILTDRDNLLESGIEIQVQLPGKKSQLLSLLSGGERALTAISLLFAILKTKPIPFCVLDEIESSLDEANLDRFTDYLREFAHELQFIMITHRKRTMEAADVLYGVTMDDSRVSKLISMKLTEAVGKVS